MMAADPLPGDLVPMDMEDALKTFYSRFYPFDRIYRWLSYKDDGISSFLSVVNKGPYFTRREFSMTLANQTYIRFLSFLGEADMRERIVSAAPIKIDIGAVYSARPSEKKSMLPASFIPVERELVFDIDITDYDDVRQCCKEKQMCLKCWQYIVAAVKILDAILRFDFGFQNILWVFSGRRGIHCWVADKRARALDAGLRKAILSYIEVTRNFDIVRVKNASELHPMIKRALTLLMPIFKQKILPEIFASSSTSNLVPGSVVEMFQKENIYDPLEKWKLFVQHLGAERKTKTLVAEEFILTQLYPRLDANVSIGLNHLLKAPFCVHPDSGKLCVPIDPEAIDQFDPETVPTIQSILQPNGSALLQPYLQLIDRFLDSIAEESPADKQ